MLHLSRLALAYVHSVLKSTLEHTVREEEIARNGARTVRAETPRSPKPATLSRHFNALLRDARRRPIQFHNLRHSTATFGRALRNPSEAIAGPYDGDDPPLRAASVR